MSKSPNRSTTWAWRFIGATACVALIATFDLWWPIVNEWTDTAATVNRSPAPTNHVADSKVQTVESAIDDPHAGHDHEGHDHSAGAVLDLSRQALRNLGLDSNSLRPVKLQSYNRSITLPARIVDKPGQTHLQISAPLTGVVTRVAVTKGEALLPGSLLFEMRLTHEDLVEVQTTFLKTLGELDVEKKEITRLTKVTSSGAVARRVLLEREYEHEKLDAALRAQREALLLHGLSDKQIDHIATERKLLRKIKVFVPEPGADATDSFELAEGESTLVAYTPPSTTTPPFTLDDILVQTGQAVQTGDPLCVLSNLSELYVEALAFEQDASVLADVIEAGREVAAVFDLPNGEQSIIPSLKIRFLDSQVDPESRTLSAYIELANSVVRDSKTPAGQRILAWRYRPGQRLQIRVPVERWTNRFVLPVDAVAREGAENFVFVQDGEHFDRVAVHVEYRDQFDVVIAANGAVIPGNIVARKGAHQMQMALKNAAGGGVDPHPGHSH